MRLVLVLVPLALLLDAPTIFVCHGCFCEPWPHAGASYAVVGLLLVGWPIWRHLAPRPIQVLRVLAGAAGTFGACVVIACVAGDLPLEAYGPVPDAFGIVALALYVEIARALLDRRSARAELVPEMRARRRRGGASIDAPISWPPP